MTGSGKKKSIVIMPYSSYIHSGETPILSFESQCAVRAGAHVFAQGLSEKIIIIAEDTYRGSRNTTTALMKDALMQYGVPESAIETHAPFNSSAAQLEKLHTVYPDGTFSILAFAFHMVRTKRIAKRLGIDAEYLTIEDILTQENPSWRETLHAWETSPEVCRKLGTERTLVQTIDILDGLLFSLKITRTHVLQHILAWILGPRPPMTTGPGPALPEIP
jgi:hypothetical protein